MDKVIITDSFNVIFHILNSYAIWHCLDLYFLNLANYCGYFYDDYYLFLLWHWWNLSSGIIKNFDSNYKWINVFWINKCWKSGLLKKCQIYVANNEKLWYQQREEVLWNFLFLKSDLKGKRYSAKLFLITDTIIFHR